MSVLKIKLLLVLFCFLILLLLGCVDHINKIDSNSHKLNKSELMQGVFNEFNMVQAEDINTLKYFEELYVIGWDENSFRMILNDFTDFVGPQVNSINLTSKYPVFVNFGIKDLSSTIYMETNFYYSGGQYWLIIMPNLKKYPASSTALKFWMRDYNYPLAHEMRHVKRIIQSGIFDKPRSAQEVFSAELYREYTDYLLRDMNFPCKFNSQMTADDLEELIVVLQTDNPVEIALNIDRLNNFPINILENDVSLDAEIVVPHYLMQIVLARHLKEVYSKPSIKKTGYSIRDSAFDEMQTWSDKFRSKLYEAYPADTDSIKTLEEIFEKEAQKAVRENYGQII
jgi:hypothetical protein